MDEKRKAEAQARYAGMETAILERMWVREERVDWAQAALHDELVSRGVDFEGMAARVAGPPPVAPTWIRPLDSPSRPELRVAEAPVRGLAASRVFVPVFLILLAWTMAFFWVAVSDHSMTAATRRIVLPLVFLAMGGFGMFRIRRTGFRHTFVVTWVVGLVIGSMIWAARPTKAIDTASLMEGMDAVDSSANARAELRQRVVRQMRGSISAWRHHYVAIDSDIAKINPASLWRPERFTPVAERDAVARDALAWRSGIAAAVAEDDSLVKMLQNTTSILPVDLREQFTRTVVSPAKAFTDAEKQRLAIAHEQAQLIDKLLSVAGKQSPAVNPMTGKASFAGVAAAEYTALLSRRDALSGAEADATSRSDAAYDAFARDAELTLGRLGD